MGKNGGLETLPKKLVQNVKKEDVTQKHIWYAIRGALNPKLLISNLAEALRITESETENLLDESGFSDVIAQKHLQESETRTIAPESLVDYKISEKKARETPPPSVFSIEFAPKLNENIKISTKENTAIQNLVKGITETASSDAFADLYRSNVMDYYNNYMETDAKLIDKYIQNNFERGQLKYIFNSGIGGNEQFNHFVAALNNKNPQKKLTWIVADSPKHLDSLPNDANIENTLFMEFSRSGKTEETVKIHEFTPRKKKCIVFANSGPLRELGERDNSLVLNLPDQVSGRFGRNKTPILLAPMHVAGLDTKKFWGWIDNAIEKFDLSSPNSLPLQIAQFIFLYQKQNKINHIYLGCLGNTLLKCADELVQFWDESVAKNQNDIMMSRYIGLPRDSHTVVEGLLSNAKTKMGIFLFQEEMLPEKLPPTAQKEIDPINESHKGLIFGDEEKILAEANYQRFSELMPTIKITTQGKLSLEHAAVLGQLWADITFCYAKLKNVDPGSSPEVKYVRDRSAELLGKR